MSESDKLLFESLKASVAGGVPEIDIDVASATCNLARHQMIDLFRSFESNGLGRLVIGRHKYKTRFVFNHSGSVIDSVKANRNAQTVDLSTSHELVTYPFFIRPNLKVAFQLPSDLSSVEAERIAAFVKTLSIESPISKGEE